MTEGNRREDFGKREHFKGGATLNRWYHFKQVGHFRNPVFKTGSCFEMPGLKQ